MTEQQNTRQEITCPRCGRDFAPDVLIWSEQNGEPLCPDCLAEEKSCGCADD